jgi:hypothetical protein
MTSYLATYSEGFAFSFSMKAYGVVEVQLHAFLTSVLDGGEWSSSRPCGFTAGTHSIGD